MSTDSFKASIWSATILDNFNDEMVFKNCANTDYEGEIKGKGDIVKIHSVGRVTVATYTPGVTSISPETLDGATMPFPVNQADYFAFEVDDVDAAQMQPNVMAAGMKEAAFAFANAADEYVAAKIAAGVASANIADAVVVGGSNTSAYRLLVRMQRLLNDANTPRSGRWAVGPYQLLEELLLDPRFVSFGTSSSRGTIMSGLIEELLGFKLYFSNNTPVSGSEYSLLGGCTQAVTFANNIPENSTEAYRPQDAFSDAVKGLHLYDCMVTRPKNLVKVPVTFADGLGE